MSRKTPLVINGQLRDVNIPLSIALDSPEWFAWLADQSHRSFHFNHPTGGFTARKERRQRGQWYWVAYRQAHNHLHKIYLGKSETLTEAHLREAATALAASTQMDHPPNP